VTTFQYCSDLHLEFRENKQYLTDHPLVPCGKILLLAGDIVPFAVMNKHAGFFDFIADHFDTVYWLPGNHEYYHSDLADRCGVLNEKVRRNVFLVNNVAIYHGDVRLIFSTLWSVISPANQWAIQQGMSDFRLIKYQGRSFTAADFNEQHATCRNFLETELGRKHENTIVVSHHLPTLLNYPERFKGDVLNEGFATELFDLVEGSNARYWIYGHHHQYIPEFSIGSTKLVNNQLGYVKYDEHRMFDHKAVITLDSCAISNVGIAD
jgi:predicted phosphohydrolase